MMRSEFLIKSEAFVEGRVMQFDRPMGLPAMTNQRKLFMFSKGEALKKHFEKENLHWKADKLTF